MVFLFWIFKLWYSKLLSCLGGNKGHLILKADWRAIDSPKKRMDEFVLFAFLLFTSNESNSFVCFLGESTASHQLFGFI